MKSSVRVAITDESQVGEARRNVSQIARSLRYSEALTSNCAIVVTEMARNVVRHGGGGELLIRELPDPVNPSLELLALDRGPGMRNVSECMRDGFSTYGTAGSGLGAIGRLAGRFEIHSAVGKGTVVWARICHPMQGETPKAYEVGAVSVALDREPVCGDAWELHYSDERLRLMVADGLGHGPFAEEAAREAVSIFRTHPAEPMAELLRLMHLALSKTRGAAVAIGDVLIRERQVRGAGVGNIATRVVHHTGSKNLVSDNGTVGASFRKVLEFSQPWQPGSLLIMHSDGVSTQWNLDDYPGLSHRHPSLIAGVLYRDFKRTRDDATIVVVRHDPQA